METNSNPDLSFTEMYHLAKRGDLLSSDLKQESVVHNILRRWVVKGLQHAGYYDNYSESDVANKIIDKINSLISQDKTYLTTSELNSANKLLELFKAKNLPDVEIEAIDTAQNKIKTLISKIQPFEKLQAAFRGYRTRQNIVYPKQIITFLNEALLFKLEPAQVQDVAIGLCREINELTANPNANRGKSIRLDKLKKEYHYTIPGEKEKSFKIPFDFVVEMPQDGNSITLLIIPPTGSKLGEGTYKTAEKAQNLKIKLKLNVDKSRDGSESSMVRLSQRGVSENDDILVAKRSGSVSSIESGEEIQKTMLNKVPGIRIVELHRKRLPDAQIQSPKTQIDLYTLMEAGIGANFPDTTSDNSSNDYERFQMWYNSDLQDVFDKGTIPIDLKPSTPPRKVTTDEKFALLISIAEPLESMHNEGFIHCDVKPKNFLVKLNSEGKLEIYLSDFDLAAPINTTYGSGQYFYWDSGREAGVPTPFTDVFSLTMSLGSLFLPDFFNRLNNKEFLYSDSGRDFVLNKEVNILVKKILSNPKNNRILEAFGPLNPSQNYESPENLVNKLKNCLSVQNLTDDEKQIIKRLIKDILITMNVFSVIHEIIKCDIKLKDWLIQHPNIYAVENPIQELSLFLPNMSIFKEELIALKDQIKIIENSVDNWQ